MSDKCLERVAHGLCVSATMTRHKVDHAPGATKKAARGLEQYISAHSGKKNAKQVRTEASLEVASVWAESAIS